MGNWSDDEKTRVRERDVAYNLGVQSCDAEIAALKRGNAALNAALREYEERHGVEKLIDNHIQAETDVLRSEVAKRDRALAAGPAALRAKWGSANAQSAEVVEAAQAAAMKEGT